ncbi:MAG: hypothetical protein ACI89L_000037 [Phycisphaerales bacterium]|jgi:uncharacterized protein YhfF
MKIPESVLPFWHAYEASVGCDLSARFYESFYFADSEAVANDLAELVLAGTKRATAGLLWAYEQDSEPLPKPGGLSVVTMFDGTPRCVIETSGVETVAFEDVSVEFAATEGEGDRSLEYWREAHWKFFQRSCRQMGREPTPRMPVVCERFEVVFRG